MKPHRTILSTVVLATLRATATTSEGDVSNPDDTTLPPRAQPALSVPVAMTTTPVAQAPSPSQASPLAAEPSSMQAEWKTKNGTLQITPILYLQARLETSIAENADGTPYNVTRAVDGNADRWGLYLRRWRPGFRATYDKRWIVMFLVSADGWGRKSGGNTLGLDTGTFGVDFETGPITHSLQFGKHHAEFGSASRYTFNMLMPVNRPSSMYGPPLTTGFSCRSTWDTFTLGTNAFVLGGDDTSSRKSRGAFYGARLVWAGFGPFRNGVWRESFLGESGQGFSLALDAGYSHNEHGDIELATADVQPGMFRSATTGAELLLHWNGLSALGEVRQMRRWSLPEGTTRSFERHGRILVAQTGYATKIFHSIVLEPSLRFSRINLDRNNHHEGSSYGPGPDNGLSGYQFDSALTLYLHGHNNKLGLHFQRWLGESSPDGNRASATVLRLQQQILF